MLSMLEQVPQFDLFQFLQVTGTPGTLLVIYIVWWRTVGKEKADQDKATADAHKRTATILGEVSSNLYRLHDKTERLHKDMTEEAKDLLSRGERVVERLDERFPSGTISPPRHAGA